MGSLKVAISQAEPLWLDLPGTVKKTCSLIEEAAHNGAQLIAFPECWLTGYPAWIWSRPVDFDLSVNYAKHSLAIDSPEMRQICATAGENSIAVVLGFSERGPTGSLYIGQAIISPAGEVLMHRRKVKPTHVERTVFGDGSGDDLKNVAEIDFGGDVGKLKVGTLACWEHTQPLLKYHTYSQGEALHVAMWPPMTPFGGLESPGLWSMSDEGCLNLSQTYAIEGGGFVLHATSLYTEKGIKTFGMEGHPLFGISGGGASVALAPDGRRLTEPLGKRDTEGIVYANLDLNKIIANKSFIDVVGHYSRPDLLWLGYDDSQKTVKRKGVAVNGGP